MSPPKIVILLKLMKDLPYTSISEQRASKESFAAEKQSVESLTESPSIVSFPKLVKRGTSLLKAVSGDAGPLPIEPLPERPTNVKYELKNRTEPIASPRELIENIGKKSKSCFERCFKCKKKEVVRQEEEPEEMVVRPSQLEFQFSKDPYIGELGHQRHVRLSTVKNISFTPNKLYNLGERGSGFKTKGEPQDFYKLRDKCLAEGVLFEDPEFPALYSSICADPDKVDFITATQNMEWQRPIDIVKKPKLFVNGYSRFDVQQGALGDCWLLAGLASLTIYMKLFSQIVPEDQGFGNKYAGIFHFRFWQFGRWLDVVIDDKLPMRPNSTKPLFLQSVDENEFWSPLIEKAYAKHVHEELHHSYDALMIGHSCESMVDLTGGICESYYFNAAPPDFFNILLKAYERASLITAAIDCDPNIPEAITPEGLVRGHGFSVTKVARIALIDLKTVNLIRVRNPWGSDKEWNGAWSDRSPEWNSVSPTERQRIGLVFENDGEFWMSFDDFIKYFDKCQICNLNPDCMSYERTNDNGKRWEMSIYEGEWVPGVTAGGSITNDTFCNNPQYRVILTEVDDNDDQCTLVICLTQKFRRRERKLVAFIGITVVHIVDPNSFPTPLDKDFLKGISPVAQSEFSSTRDVLFRTKLSPGTYIIIPSTFYPDTESQFLLRIFTEKKNIMTEHDNDTLSYDAATEDLPDGNYESQGGQLFLKISGDDNEVDWQELKFILDKILAEETKNRGFSSDICRSMIAMLDIDLTGKLNYFEFKKLWNNVFHWKNIFYDFDKDQSGTFSSYELREALAKAGFKLNFRILNKLMLRFGNKTGELNFEDFIMCAIKVKTLIDLFEYKATETKVELEIEEWMELIISAT